MPHFFSAASVIIIEVVRINYANPTGIKPTNLELLVI
jgi:hypothetical protein